MISLAENLTSLSIRFKMAKAQGARRKTQDAKGQALFFALFLLAIFGALSGTLAVMWETQNRVRALDRDGSFALYLAQAGIERAKIMVLSGYWTVGTYNITDQNDLDIAGDNYQFLYDVRITNGGGATRTLRGTGRVLDLAGNELSHREVQMVAIGISDVAPPIGQDDDMAGSPVAWSWREQ